MKYIKNIPCGTNHNYSCGSCNKIDGQHICMSVYHPIYVKEHCLHFCSNHAYCPVFHPQSYVPPVVHLISSIDVPKYVALLNEDLQMLLF